MCKRMNESINQWVNEWNYLVTFCLVTKVSDTKYYQHQVQGLLILYTAENVDNKERHTEGRMEKKKDDLGFEIGNPFFLLPHAPMCLLDLLLSHSTECRAPTSVLDIVSNKPSAENAEMTPKVWPSQSRTPRPVVLCRQDLCCPPQPRTTQSAVT